MTLPEIETFLAVVEQGTVSAAARKLYVSQSTVSHRLRTLEEQLNMPLFVRGKGQHMVTPTAAGENFIPIAHRWLSLWRDTQMLENHPARQEIAVGSVDLVNNYTFVPLYQSILHSHPELRLDIRTHHSEEIHALLSSHCLDVGFVFSRLNLPDLCARPIYRELMYLVCNRENPYQDGIDPAQLRAEDEIYLKWGNDFEDWHDSWWPSRAWLARVNTGSMLEHYLADRPNRWSVVPMSLVAVLRRNPNIVSYCLQFPPPPRICYQLTRRFPAASRTAAVELFLTQTAQFIDREESICAFQPWMLAQDR